MKSPLVLFIALFICLCSCSTPVQTGIKTEEQIHREKVLHFQVEMNEKFKNPEQSPLPAERVTDFSGLDFFPINFSYRVIADFVETPDEKPFPMPTSTDRTPMYRKVGEAHFKLFNISEKLSLYKNDQVAKIPGYENRLFVPFRDLTNGEDTYGGGRYIDVSAPKNKRVVIDFNQAYNPYCAYSDRYSCPIPPKENDLDIPIRAGVMAYEDGAEH